MLLSVLAVLLSSTLSVYSNTLHVNLSLTVEGNSEACDRGLSNGGEVYLQYRGTLPLTSWHTVGNVSLTTIKETTEGCNFTQGVEGRISEGNASQVQFRLLQAEHGGGMCNCWGVMAGRSWSVRMEGTSPSHV